MNSIGNIVELRRRLGLLVVALLLPIGLVGCAASGSVRWPAAELRCELPSEAQLCVPAEALQGDDVDLVVHFHGAPETVIREFKAAGVRAALVIVNRPGLSRAYGRPFSEAGALTRLLDDAEVAMAVQHPGTAPAQWRYVCLTSFSAGYGAVRAILRNPDYYRRVDAALLADSMYAGYARDGTHAVVNAEDIAPFCRFAEEATAGRKYMLITHTYLEPEGYAGTHETADALLQHVGVERIPVENAGDQPLPVISRAERGNLHVFGCAGTTGDDHMAHLRNLRWLLGRWCADRAKAGR